MRFYTCVSSVRDRGRQRLRHYFKSRDFSLVNGSIRWYTCRSRRPSYTRHRSGGICQLRWELGLLKECYCSSISMVLLCLVFDTSKGCVRVIHSREIGVSYVCSVYNWSTGNRMDTKSHPTSIKLPGTVEVFGNLKNAKRFAIDIGKIPNSCINVNVRNTIDSGTFTFFALLIG